MLETVRKIYSILSLSHKKAFIRLQLLVIVSAVAEVISLASIAPFIVSITNPQSLSSNSALVWIKELLNITTENEFFFFYGIVILISLLLSSVLSIFTAWRIARYSYSVGADIGNRLFTHYMYQPWVFHANENTSRLSRNINTESARVSGNVINPLIQMNSKIVTSVLIIVMLGVYNLSVSLTILLVFSVSYFLIYKVVKNSLLSNGRQTSAYFSKRFKLLSEGLGGVKDILLMSRQDSILKEFTSNGELLAKNQGNNQAMITAPKSLLELVIYSTIILVVLAILYFFKINTNEILPTLSIYALAGIKLMPAFQQIYFGLSTITSNFGALESVYSELIATNKSKRKQKTVKTQPFRLEASIKLKDIYFRYPDKKEYTLKRVNLEIGVNDVIGIIGESGSGKSTLTDIILGLLHPVSGQISLDGRILDGNLLEEWQKSIGYVPQSIYLSDASIKENIAFALPYAQIDDALIEKSLEHSQLKDFIDSLPDGVNTRVGERGVQLSGGQRQRIGIARALYNNPSVLVFDEATSALDESTESQIVSAIESLAGSRTIIMIAHRISTLSPCNRIIELKNKSIYREITYEHLKSIK